MITRTKLENIFQTNNTQRDIVYKKLQPTNRNIIRKRNNLFGFNIVPDHRTFIDDYLKIVEFIDWLKDFYPEKAKFLTKNSV